MKGFFARLAKLFKGNNARDSSSAVVTSADVVNNDKFEGLLVGLEPHLIITLRQLHANDPKLKQYSLLVDENLRSQAIEVFSYALLTNTILTHFYLPGNGIGNEGAKHLATALRTNTSLNHLNLGSNKIGDEGAKYIATALLTSYTSLSTFDLQKNHIGSKGAKYIATLLLNNATLVRLNLQFNNIGDAGAKHIATALLTNTTLTCLNLGYNIIGDVGASAILEAVKINTTVTDIVLDNNNIADDYVVYLINTALIRNKNIKKQIDEITKPLYKLDSQDYPTWQTKSLTHATELNKNIDQIIAQNPIFKQSKLLQELYSLKFICLAHHCYNEYLFRTEYKKEEMLKLVTEYLSCAEVMGYNTTLVQQIVTTDINETLNAHHRMYLDKTLPGNIEREAYRNTQRREYYAYTRWQLRQSLNWPKPTEQELIKAAEPLKHSTSNKFML